MAALIDTLGQRILQAARLAVAVHLNQVAESELNRGQRVVIGRAGPQMQATESPVMDFSTDGALPAFSAERVAG